MKDNDVLGEKLKAAFDLLMQDKISYSTFPIPGFELAEEAIPAREQAVVKVPAIKIVVDSQTGSRIGIGVLGYKTRFDLGKNNLSLVFDGQELIGQETSINLKDKSEHELIINCR